MLIYLYGSDSYRRQKKLNFYIKEYKNKYSNISCDFFDLGNPEEFKRLKEFSTQGLLFANKKMAVLKNFSGLDIKDFKKNFKNHLKSEDFIFLVSDDKLATNEFTFLSPRNLLIEKFDQLKGEQWRFFVEKEIQKRKITLTLEAINFLARGYEGDSWGLINELEKISLISSISPIRLIGVEDLKKIGDYPYQSSDIFGFINAVIRKQEIAQRITALEKLFINQEEPIKIFNILASLKRLPAKLIQKLADYDVMVKSGKMDYEEVLLDLAIQ